MAVKPDAPAAEPDYSTWTVADLEAEAAYLADERTAVRLRQNAVADALNAARVLAGLSPNQLAAIATLAGKRVVEPR